jgi:predicted regulator of Ras-like GTPase activity (Roadblock/LC7/MglB family)
VSEDVRSLTAELAADPSSLVFLRLGEALRQSGRLEAAAKVVLQGLSRYPNLPEAHDLYARVLVDHQDLEGAFDEWDMTLRLDPAHGGAHKGLAFLYYKAGEHEAALRHLQAAASDRPGDSQVEAAIAKVSYERQARTAEAKSDTPEPETVPEQPPTPPAAKAPAVPPPERFEMLDAPGSASPGDDLLTEDGRLLVAAAGLRLLGTLARAGGGGVADRVAAELAGVSREAVRATRLLDLGDWHSVAIEAAGANFFLVPPTAETLLLIMRDATMPMGRVAIGAQRAMEAAKRWLAQGT